MDTATETTQLNLLPPEWSVAAFAVVAIIVLWGIHLRRSTRPGTLIWMGVFTAMALFLGCWCANGLCGNVAVYAYLICLVVLLAFGVGVCLRERLCQRIGALRDTPFEFSGAMPSPASAEPGETQLHRHPEGSAERGVEGSPAAGNHPQPAEDSTTPFASLGMTIKSRFTNSSSAGSTPAGNMRRKAADITAKASKPATRILGELLPWLRDAALLTLAALFSLLAMETADNPAWPAIPDLAFEHAFLLLLMALAALYFLGQRRGSVAALGVAVCLALGLGEAFVDLFKGTVIFPADLLALGTAAEVSSTYTFALSTQMMWSITSATAALGAMAFIVPVPRGKRLAIPWRVAAVAVNLLCCALLANAVYADVTQTKYQRTYDLTIDYWNPRATYHGNGMLMSLVAISQNMVVDVPRQYSEDLARKAEVIFADRYDMFVAPQHQDAVERFAQVQPNIIAIMNETYSDLSIFDQLHVGYTGTFVTQELAGDAQHGMLHMSIHGGGTCNSEFEFLTGTSMALLGKNMYPYQQFSLEEVNTLPRQLGELGYHTVAIHPANGSNWGRQDAYPSMGFQETHFIDSFEDARRFHGFVSDGATYDLALSLLEENDEPQFIFDVTIQNHGGYSTGNIPVEQRTSYVPDFGSEASVAELNEYLSCIQASDRDLQTLLEELNAFDEPVAVVFFGDHQPGISRNLGSLLFPWEDSFTASRRLAQTPYFIWMNYDMGTYGEAGAITDGAELEPALTDGPWETAAWIDGVRTAQKVVRMARSLASATWENPAPDAGAQPDTAAPEEAPVDSPEAAMAVASAEIDPAVLEARAAWDLTGKNSSANFLAAQLLEQIGAPLTDYQKAQLMLQRKLPAVSAYGYLDQMGVWHRTGEPGDTKRYYRNLQYLTYYETISKL